MLYLFSVVPQIYGYIKTLNTWDTALHFDQVPRLWVSISYMLYTLQCLNKNTHATAYHSGLGSCLKGQGLFPRRGALIRTYTVVLVWWPIRKEVHTAGCLVWMTELKPSLHWLLTRSQHIKFWNPANHNAAGHADHVVFLQLI